MKYFRRKKLAILTQNTAMLWQKLIRVFKKNANFSPKIAEISDHYINPRNIMELLAQPECESNALGLTTYT